MEAIDKFNSMFQTELAEADVSRSIARLITRIDFIFEHINCPEDFRNLNDIYYIMLRYRYSMQMRVPIERTQLSESEDWTVEYVYFSPHNWCYVCKLSRTSDEICCNRCKSCNCDLFSNDKIHIGSPSSKAYVYLNYLPSCYITEVKRVLPNNTVISFPFT